MKENIDKLDFIETKTFCSLKDIVRKIKSKIQNKRKYSQYTVSDKGLISRIYKAFFSLRRRDPVQMGKRFG